MLRVVPVCRPVEANEVATPAIERGIPEMAVTAIGGLPAPIAAPNSAYRASTIGSGLVGATQTSPAPARTSAAPAITNDRREPRRPTNQPVKGASANNINPT